MEIGVNSLYQIKQIGSITDTSLKVIEIDETDELFPFVGWSEVKILCYCYKQDDNGVSVYPYIDTNIIDKLDNLGATIDALFGGV